MIILAVTLPIHPDQRERAIEVALEMTAETHKEQGCIAYTFMSPIDNPNTLFVYEEWADQAALDGHNSADHMKRFQEAIGPVLDGDVKVSKYLLD